MLRLDKILEEVLNESVSAQDIIKAIKNRNNVKIYYDDDINVTKYELAQRPKVNVSDPKGERLIQPYVFGTTISGKDVLRAFQIGDHTRRGRPKWKYFRLDRITNWKPLKSTFSMEPADQGYNAEAYNPNGDKSMIDVFAQVSFDDMSDIDKIKNQRNAIKNAPKVSGENTTGAIPFASQVRKKNVYTSHPNSDRYKQIRQNIDDTARDSEEKKNYFADYDKAEFEMNNKKNSTGPIHNNDYEEEMVPEEDWMRDDFTYEKTE